VDHVHLAIRAGFKSVMPYIALTMILLRVILPIYRKDYLKTKTDFFIVLAKAFVAVFGVMFVFHLVPKIFFEVPYVPMCFYKLLLPLSILILVVAFALSFL
ncbi:YjiH family protein, partial [Staphylococcus pseudintermedius]